MGTVGDAYDNAMAESFFASLEAFTWIESWYNPRRRHSALNFLSPINFERRKTDPIFPSPENPVHDPETA